MKTKIILAAAFAVLSVSSTGLASDQGPSRGNGDTPSDRRDEGKGDRPQPSGKEGRTDK